MRGNRLAMSLGSLIAAAAFLGLINTAANALLGPYGQRLLISWGINSLLAVSLNLVNGQTGQFSLGHAGFMAVGAYTSALLAVSHPQGLTHVIGNSVVVYVWVGALFLAAGAVAAVAGTLIAVPTFRLRGDYLAIATLGFGEMIFVLLLNLPQTGGARGLGGIPQFTTVALTFGVLMLGVITIKNLVASRFGRAFASIREDEIAAEAVGINTTKYKVLAFTVGAFFAGVAGALYAHYQVFMVPHSFRFMKSVEIVIMCILGGSGSTTGAILGAGVLTILPEWLRLQERLRLPVDPRMVLFSALLIVLMLVRRQGLLGSRELSLSLLRLVLGKGRRHAAHGSNTAGSPHQPSTPVQSVECRAQTPVSDDQGHGSPPAPPIPRSRKAPILESRGCTLSFGGLKAVDGLDLHINEGEIVGLIGPNGAGKTTFFNTICGVYRPQTGDVLFRGERVQGGMRWGRSQGLRPYQVARMGIVRTFQNLRLFPQLSVVENIKVAMSTKSRYGFASALFRPGGFISEEERLEREALALVGEFGLSPWQNERAGSLPYGEQRRLELARALALEPRLLLLDEPTAGMNPRETHGLMELILRIREERNLSILLIEHDMRVVMGICQRVIVLDHGVKIAEGAPEVVRKEPKVMKAYLGEE